MKNVLITGASSGIGLEISNILKETGYKIFKTGRRNLNEENYFSCDFNDINSITNLYCASKDYFEDSVDVLINCCGQYIYKQIENMSLQEIDNLININFKSTYYLTSLIIRDMKKKNWGRIVNIGSISGVVGEGNATLYSATKAALSGFTKALALEVAQNNITVNQINPGWVETPLVENNLTKDDIKEVIDVTPQKRFIEPIEVAKLCEYLISENAKGLTGQNINLCAGLSIGC